MTTKQRFLAAISGQKPDRLPVTTHHVMPYFLKKYLNDADNMAFFRHFGLDAIHWVYAYRGDADGKERLNEGDDPIAYSVVVSDGWRVEREIVSGQNYPTTRYTIVTPGGNLTTVIQQNEHTHWVVEHLVKEKKDVDLIGEFCTAPKCDTAKVNADAAAFGQDALIRGGICAFDLYGQPGCWQDAACLVGIEKLIMATFDDPGWVKALLEILFRRKQTFIRSTRGARYDILELGGGDASSTVISPALFDEYVAPYDSRLIEEAHNVGQKIVYHTCGGMMPILNNIKSLGTDAMETFTPVGMGADVDLKKAREILGSRMCMIGGFDQFHFFTDCTPRQTRAEVRRCFEAAGREGAFILCPSDHFFDAEPELIKAFSDEAKTLTY
jgi:uroporphyrinogen-III decarboxylase